MRKILALVAVASSFVFALGLNCIPNIPKSALGSLPPINTNFLNLFR